MNCRTHAGVSASALTALALTFVFGIRAPSASDTSPMNMPTDSWLSQVKERMGREEYCLSRSEQGLQAPNRSHGVRTYFDPTGLEVVPRIAPSRAAAAWSLTWHTTSWGRLGQELPVGTAVIEFHGARADYRYETGLVEWYVNGTDGLEQGFDLLLAPPGDGPVVVVAEIGAELNAHMEGDGGEAIIFTDHQGTPILRYGNLHVIDAAGKSIPAAIELALGEVRLVVDDHDARYPIHVDPLLTAYSWSSTGEYPGDEFGTSVAIVGDVNGDGISEVLIGAPFHDRGAAHEGAAYLYFGIPGSMPSTTASWWAYAGLGDGFGTSVSCAGDVDGDGRYEIIIGAPHSALDLGEAFVWTAQKIMAQLGSLPVSVSSADWSGRGTAVGGRYGQSVCTAGDVNADGLDDIIIGSPYYPSPTGPLAKQGRVLIYKGTGGTSPYYAPFDILDYADPGAEFGTSVANANRITGIYDAVIIGAPFGDTTAGGCCGEGLAFIYQGGANGMNPDSQDMYGPHPGSWFGFSVAAAGIRLPHYGWGFPPPPEPMVVVGAPNYGNVEVNEGAAYVYTAGGALVTTFESNLAGAHLGYSVAYAGDMNCDGGGDIVVGAYTATNPADPQANEGMAFLYESTLPEGFAPGARWVGDSDQVDSWYGCSVAGGGDINGDQKPDVIVGARHFDSPGHGADGGAAFVYTGECSLLTSTPAWAVSLPPTTGGQFFGHSVAGGADVNGDGYDDVAVGAPLYDGGVLDQGQVLVYAGSVAGLALTPIWSGLGGDVIGHFGWSVALAADINADNRADLVVGAPGANKVRVYYSGTSGFGATQQTVTGPVGLFGHSVAARDITLDGLSDVLVGAPGYTNGQSSEGAAFLYSSNGCCGPPYTLSPTPPWQMESGQPSASFGESVAFLDPVLYQGAPQIAVGSPGYGTGGAVSVYGVSYWDPCCDPGSLPPILVWTGLGPEAACRFGTSVSAAGDVNGDLLGDLIVGAPGYGDEAGAALLYQWYDPPGSSPATFPSTPNWMVASTVSGANFGQSVATLGNLDRDNAGTSDIVVGAPAQSSGGAQAGRVFIWLGNKPAGLGPSGNPLSADWSTSSSQIGDEFGYSVAGAGDVNGDMIPDLIVGAHRYNAGSAAQGRAFLFDPPGLPMLPRQIEVSTSNLIPRYGTSDSQSAFRLRAHGRSPLGLGRLRMEWCVADESSSLEDAPIHIGAWREVVTDDSLGLVAFLEESVTGLQQERAYKWRMRVRADSPYGIPTPWFTLGGAASSLAQLRTAAPTRTGVAVGQPGDSSQKLLGAIGPNPLSTESYIHFALEKQSHVALDIFDARGRRVMTLIDEDLQAGPHSVVWNGRDTDGSRVPGGVFFVRMRANGETETRKLILDR